MGQMIWLLCPVCGNKTRLRTCIHSRNRRMGEGFSRQARQIFAGIIVFISRKFNAAWRERTRPNGDLRL